MKSLGLIIHLIFAFIYLSQWIVRRLGGDSFTTPMISLLEVEIIALYFFDIWVIAKAIGSTSVMMFFNISFGIFLLSRIFTDLIGYGSLSEVISLVTVTIPPWAIASTLEVFLFLLIIQIPLYFIFSAIIRPREQRPIRDDLQMKCAKLLFLLFTPAMIYRSFVEIKSLSTAGYASLYRGGLADVEMPIIARISTFVLPVAFLFILANRPSRREFLGFSLFFFLTQVVDMLKGARGGFMISLFYLLWYHNKFFDKKIKLGKLLLAVPILIFFMMAVASARVEGSADFNGLIGMVLMFLVMQGTSFTVTALYITNEHVFINNRYPYILDPLYYLINISRHPQIANIGQTQEMILLRNDLGHHLTYFLNPNYYLNGMSIGTSFVAELYELGFIGLFAGMALLLATMVYFEKCTTPNNQSRFLMLMSLSIFSLIVYTPRANFFPNTYDLLKLIVTIVFISCIVHGIRRVHCTISKNRGWSIAN